MVRSSQAGLYAWALMPNHAHVLLRTGTMPLSRLALRWLGPYAGAFNRTHRRVGYLFQNRFKSILVEADPYFLELVRYIHLNPVRSRLPVNLDLLDQYPWTGHAVLLGHRPFPAQDTAAVLNRFGATVGAARQADWEFIRRGMSGRAPDLQGGGLRRSSGGWHRATPLARGRERGPLMSAFWAVTTLSKGCCSGWMGPCPQSFVMRGQWSAVCASASGSGSA